MKTTTARMKRRMRTMMITRSIATTGPTITPTGFPVIGLGVAVGAGDEQYVTG